MKGFGVKRNNTWLALVTKDEYEKLVIFCKQRGINKSDIEKVNLDKIDYMSKFNATLEILHTFLLTHREKAVYDVFTKEENDIIGYSLSGLSIIENNYDLDDDEAKIIKKAIKIVRKKVNKNKVKHKDNTLDLIKMVIEMPDDAKQLALYGHYGMHEDCEFG